MNDNADCYVDAWHANAMEKGKFFPATQAGLADVFARDDARNDQPPDDGRIAGSSVNGDLPVLNEQTPRRWKKNAVRSGAMQSFTWEYSAIHKTRRWNYFITKSGWNASAPLTRAQFEEKPFCTVQNAGQPYWSPSADLMPKNPTIHQCRLPERSGYQVILAVWEVADTPMGFYQVIDTEFVSGNMGDVVSPFGTK